MWLLIVFFFFKQRTAYEMRISDWSSDVCSSDLPVMQNPLLLSERATDAARSGNSVGARRAYRLGHTGSKPILEQSRSAGGNQEPCRSEERRGGKECVSTGRSRWSPEH